MQYSSPDFDKQSREHTMVFVPEKVCSDFESEYTCFNSFFSDYFLETSGHPLLEKFGLESIISMIIHKEEHNFFN